MTGGSGTRPGGELTPPLRMSGVSKSSLLQELARRDYRTVDTDDGDYHETVDVSGCGGRTASPLCWPKAAR